MVGNASDRMTAPPLAIVKSFVEDAIQALQGNDTGNGHARMNMADQRLRAAGNSPSIKEIMVFVDDTIESLLQNMK